PRLFRENHLLVCQKYKDGCWDAVFSIRTVPRSDEKHRISKRHYWEDIKMKAEQNMLPELHFPDSSQIQKPALLFRDSHRNNSPSPVYCPDEYKPPLLSLRF